MSARALGWTLVQAAAEDPRLSGSQLRVFIRLCRETNGRTFQPVKVLWVARQLAINKATVSRAMRRLALLGYVHQDRMGSGRVIHRFRLAPAPPDVPAPFSARGAA